MSPEPARIQGLAHLARLKKEFFLSESVMESLISDFHGQLKQGLDGDESCFAMLPSYIHELPTGLERGNYFGLDLGGTNFRAIQFNFDGRGGARVVREHKVRIPEKLRRHTSKEQLFDFFVEVLEHICKGDGSNSLGFTFSFPINQTSVKSGELLMWTKGFDIPGVVGENVIALFEQALERKAKQDLKVRVLINDTVGTLATGKFRNRNCVVGLILGTGTNAAYIERSKNVRKEANLAGEDIVINVEWGAFGDIKRNLPYTEFDLAIDEDSPNQGKQCFEKMISGYYLGEIVRRMLLFLQEKGEVFQQASYNPRLNKPYSLDSSYVSVLDKHLPAKALAENFRRFEADFEISGASSRDRAVISEVCAIVCERSARLTALGLSALLLQVDSSLYEGVPAVGIDGSLFEHNTNFRKHLEQSLAALGTRCDLFLSKDGSGEGAALLACVLDHRSKL